MVEWDTVIKAIDRGGLVAVLAAIVVLAYYGKWVPGVFYLREIARADKAEKKVEDSMGITEKQQALLESLKQEVQDNQDEFRRLQTEIRELPHRIQLPRDRG